VIARLVLSIVLLLACLLPVVSEPRLASVIGDRIKTFTDLGHDESFDTRLDMYRVLVDDAIHDPFGQGIKNPVLAHGMAIDSGILTVFFSLGWLGSALFGAGIISLFFEKGRQVETNDEFLRVGKAAMIAILSQTVGGNVFVSVIGVTFWSLTGMYMAGRRHACATREMEQLPA
jgi:hypothetical protein